MFPVPIVKLKDLVTHERGRLNLFRYPTHDIGTYLGRGALDVIVFVWDFDHIWINPARFYCLIQRLDEN